ncbi:27632_t:CDS:2 [Dentiscutata erythropus]|uniref:27632_t:CDS:1 n=1 Tax=Dentiscutata erythropus TaxID=1348616 RepID=A0A9N9IG12_9GLOM|nr:27632_t:CDS:2 [Dentiscutata erythropus]
MISKYYGFSDASSFDENGINQANTNGSTDQIEKMKEVGFKRYLITNEICKKKKL